MDYNEFIQSKERREQFYGFDAQFINETLFDFQKDVVRWAVRKGRAAIFQDCGMGKTLQQIEWARIILEKIGGSALICTPLAVAGQTIREGRKIGCEIKYCKTGDDVQNGINVTNYERLHHFSPDQFGALILDESSILKNFSGKMRQEIQDFGSQVYYRLACTAMPAPNDIMEVGTHAEFLGYMRRTEMLSEYFVHDGGDTQKWRIKGHAESEFWKWMASWCVAMRKPSDLGYDNGAFELPALNLDHVVVESKAADGYLFPIESKSLNERRSARRSSLDDRIQVAADIANAHIGPVLIWCDLNDESAALRRSIPDSVEIKGSDDPETKEDGLTGFSTGKYRVLVSKPSIAGFGMNWQHCNRMVFAGLSDSYEQMYQAIRRCWRFGQKMPVQATIVTSEAESCVVANIERKERQAAEMFDELVKHIAVYSHDGPRQRSEYKTQARMTLPGFIRRAV